MSSGKIDPIVAGAAQRHKGTVKWFSDRLGYGFIDISGEEVFLHRSVLVTFGATKVQADDIVIVTLEESDRGQIVEMLFGIERPPVDDKLIATEPNPDEKIAQVKFFNDTKGYGFIEVEGVEDDVFIHSRMIEESGLSSVQTGQRILVTIEPGDKGYQVKTIRLFAE